MKGNILKSILEKAISRDFGLDGFALKISFLITLLFQLQICKQENERMPIFFHNSSIVLTAILHKAVMLYKWHAELQFVH